jgi:hypothetical protein
MALFAIQHENYGVIHHFERSRSHSHHFEGVIQWSHPAIIRSELEALIQTLLKCFQFGFEVFESYSTKELLSDHDGT